MEKGNYRPITTTIPTDIYIEIKKNRWKVPDLIMLGIVGKKGNVALIERIKEQEQKIRNMSLTLQHYVDKANGVK